jgi:glycosyltransferase involved in cell wall biosynthesis
MKIAYLIEEPSISGATREQLAQADALIARGHDARIVTEDVPLPWRPSQAEWVYVDELRQYAPREGEVVVGANWAMARLAFEIAGERAVHLLLTNDAERAEYMPMRAEIEEVYRLPIAKLAVTHPLAAAARKYSSNVTYIGGIVDDDFFRPRMPSPNEPLRVLLCGASHNDAQGIDEGYGAVAHARWFHQKVDLVRVSPYAPSREEPLDSVQEFHVALSTREMTRLMHSCDVLVAPSRRETGFGLAVAEALASGVPVVMTSIPAYTSIDAANDFGLFAPERNAVELGEKLIELLGDDELRARVRARGREVAEQWRSERVVERIEAFWGT